MPKQMFKRGDAATTAWLVEVGGVTVTLPHMSPLELEIEDLVIGAEEYLCYGRPDGHTRTFALSTAKDIEHKAVAFRAVDEVFRQFKYGQNFNRYAAHLITHANAAFQELSKSLPDETKIYRVRAGLFARVVQELEEAKKQEGLDELSGILSQSKNLSIYQDGSILLREQKFSSIALSGIHMNRYVQKFPKDAVICKEGETGDCMYVLLSGHVGVLHGGRYVAHIRRAGEAFGELALFLEGKRTATLVAETPSVLYRIRGTELPDFYRSHKDVFINIGATLIQRLFASLKSIEMFSSTSSSGQTTQIDLKSKKGREELTNLLKQIEELASKTRSQVLADLVRYHMLQSKE